MKSLTIRQPWASLIACGAKRIETRSWNTNYRGEIAIHAAKGYGVQQRTFALDDEAFRSLIEHGRMQSVITGMPLGVVVATAELVDVVPTDDMYSPDEDHDLASHWVIPGRAWWHVEGEKPFGDYTPGRYAWLLDGVKPFDEPIPAKGKQGLWEWDGCE